MPRSVLGVEGKWGTLIRAFCLGGEKVSSLRLVLLSEVSVVPELLIRLYLSALPKSQVI